MGLSSSLTSPMLHQSPDVCRELESPDIGNFVLSIVLVLGILGSYIPQHVRIYRRRSSEGLSPWFVLLGTTSGTCAIANILVLPASRTQIQCCAVNSSVSCLAGLLGIAQIGTQWCCFFLIMLLFIIFIPRRPTDTRNPLGIRVPGLYPDEGPKQALIVVATCITHLFVVLLACIVVIARYPDFAAPWANFLGLLCAALASVQYLPQIQKTWREQHIGSLSIPMMCIQTPGAFVFAASLFVRLGRKGWSAWAVYVVTGLLQGCLLGMAIVFERRDRRLSHGEDRLGTIEEDESDSNASNAENERAPLLINNHQNRSGRRLDPTNNPVARVLANASPGSSVIPPSSQRSSPRPWWHNWLPGWPPRDL